LLILQRSKFTTDKSSHLYDRLGTTTQPITIDRELVTSAKKIPNFNEFSEIKKFVKFVQKFVKRPSVGLPRVPGYPSGTRVINYPRFALYSDLLYE